ncbi:MAG: DUF1043 family protein [Gammaproteobacteria bacterium]|jgi:uncharacterized membrane-anchored protein YhcB (DUF1043 family)
MVTWVLYLCIGIVIGGMAGFYFAKLDDFSRKQKREMEEKLRKSEQELMNYKDQVTTHFRETASLINNMTDSYQKVHEHLSHGVAELCNNPVEVNKLQVSPNQLLTGSSEPAVTEKAESEAPKTNNQEDKNNNTDSQSRTRTGAADTAEAETGISGAGRFDTDGTAATGHSDMAGDSGNDVSDAKRPAIPDSPSDSAVTSPGSTTLDSSAENTVHTPDASQTMAVADDTDDETATPVKDSKTENANSEEETTAKEKSKKIRVPGSRLVH